MKAKLRGTEIYYDIAGMQLAPSKNDFIERPVLFLLHGGPGADHLSFKRHSLELQEVAQLVFIDNRGCGRSKKTKQSDYTLENNIEDIEALRKHLGLEKICILGVSYGGIVAQGYAIRYSKFIDKLILAVTAPSYHFLAQAKQTLQERGSPEQIKVAKPIWNGSFKNLAQVAKYFQLLEPLYSNAAKLKKKNIYTKSKTIFCIKAFNQGFQFILNKFNFLPKLHKITCPTLIIAGKDDWICHPDQSKKIAEKIPGSQLKIFQHSSHAVAIDEHDKYIKLIKKFLKNKTVKTQVHKITKRT
jgi:proline iminopeptidase